MLDEKYIGFILAVTSTLFIGSSFVVKKKGLLESEGHGSGVSNLSCLKSPTWWFGTFSMAFGEVLNFAAYSFAPAILVTPIGALSVAISAILASFFLKENLDLYGKIGCGLCIIGSILIVLHAPEERVITSVGEILHLMSQPGFLIYSIMSAIFTGIILWKIAPKYGKKNMLVFISLCSFAGSITVVGVKGLGIAIKLTFEGNNQFIYFSTYFFLFLVVGCTLFQLNYLNLALDLFSSAAVSPVYYVFFTTLTIVSNLLLFQGFEGQTTSDMISAFLGFGVMVVGVFLLYNPLNSLGPQPVPENDSDIEMHGN